MLTKEKIHHTIDTLPDNLTIDQVISEMNRIGDDGLLVKVPVKLPFSGDDLENLIHFLTWHETFHLGQIDLIKAAAGRGGI